MELSEVGEHVFAAKRILKQRIRKVRIPLMLTAFGGPSTGVYASR